MGNLKPGATYIYERADGVTYAREAGADPLSRIPIGWDYDTQLELKRMSEEIIWRDILDQAETNPTLKKELDRIITIYHLGKDHGKS